MKNELTNEQEDLVHEGFGDDVCPECGELYDSEHHRSDVCVKDGDY